MPQVRFFKLPSGRDENWDPEIHGKETSHLDSDEFLVAWQLDPESGAQRYIMNPTSDSTMSISIASKMRTMGLATTPTEPDQRVLRGIHEFLKEASDE